MNVWRWVLPYQHPCSCTSVIMGGVNTWTPIRPFKPIYVNTPLLSDDIDKIRAHYGIICVGMYILHRISRKFLKHFNKRPKKFEELHTVVYVNNTDRVLLEMHNLVLVATACYVIFGFNGYEGTAPNPKLACFKRYLKSNTFLKKK